MAHIIHNLDDSSRSSRGKHLDTTIHETTSSCDSFCDSSNDDDVFLYELKPRPSIILSFFLAFQVLVVLSVNVIWLPHTLSPSLCIQPDDPGNVEVISLSMFTSGLSTLLFSTFGYKFPIVQTPNIHYINTMTYILKLPDHKCPLNGDLYAMGDKNRTLEWKKRLKYVNDGVLVLSVIQCLLGLTGITGILDRILSRPQVLIPTTIIFGFYYVSQIIDLTKSSNISIHTNTSSYTGVVILTIAILLLAGFKYNKLEFHVLSYIKKKGFSVVPLKVFCLFPVLTAAVFVIIVKPLISILIFGNHDRKLHLLEDSFESSPKYLIHMPFSFGWPSFQESAIILLLPAMVIQIVESIVIFRVSNFIYGVDLERKYINLGIAKESVTTLISGSFGIISSGNPLNLSLIQLTKVGSRWIIQIAGLFLMVASMKTSLIRFLVAFTPIFVLSNLLLIAMLISITGIYMMNKMKVNNFRNCLVVGLSLYGTNMILNKMPDHKMEYDRIGYVTTTIFTSSIIICVIIAAILDCLLPNKSNAKAANDRISISSENPKSLTLWDEILAIFF